jgi:Fe-S cluster assembly protein SufD
MKMAVSNPSAFRCKIKNLDATLLLILNGQTENLPPNIPLCNGVKISTLSSGGILIHVAENITVPKPIQIVSAIQTDKPLKITQYFKVVLEKNASLTLLHCDDSLQKEQSDIINNVEITLAENARLDYYKMENKDAGSMLTNQIAVHQKAHTQFYSNVITFNAGKVNNFLHTYNF